jgi:hypothetical protein
VAEGGSGIWVPPGSSGDPRREAGAPPPQPPPTPGDVTPEQLLEEMRRLRISDLLVSTLMTVAQLGFAKLDPATRDLEQARLAIEAMRALIPVLEGAVPEETTRDFRSVVSNLQLAYVRAAEQPSAPPPAAEQPEPAEEPEQDAAESGPAEAPRRDDEPKPEPDAE